MRSEAGRIAQLIVGAALVIGGGLIWGVQGGAPEAGAAMIGAGATMLPTAALSKPHTGA